MIHRMCRQDTLFDAMDAGVERGMRFLGPVFVAAAVGLVTLCAWVFIDAVFGEVCLYALHALFTCQCMWYDGAPLPSVPACVREEMCVCMCTTILHLKAVAI